MSSRRRGPPGGFTLIELLLVVVIIGILAAVVVPRLIGRTGDAQIAAVQANLRTLRGALNLYHLDNGEFPTTDQGLDALVSKPNPEPKKWKGPYLEAKSVPRDPWGNEFVYRYPSNDNPDMFDLLSVGKDGQEGTDDDVDAYGSVEENKSSK